MDENKEYTVTIKRGFVNLQVNRCELISCIETPDGIAFTFKGGSMFTIEDMQMPSSIKQKICIADTSFKKGNLLFDLNNYVNPVSLNL